MEISNTFDDLQIYRGKDIVINEHITIHQPDLGEICEYGEIDYYNMVYTLCSVGADWKWQLADAEIDYTTIPDYELFYSFLAPMFSKEKTAILFGEKLDFSQMKVVTDHKIQDDVLVQTFSDGTCCRIDRCVYSTIVNVLRKIHRIKRNDEIPMTQATKEILIEDAREEYLQNKDKPREPVLLPLISTMVNSEGFKHNEVTVFTVKLRAFMDSVARIGKIKNADLLLQSGYSGFGVDLKKIDKEALNYMGKLD